MATDNPPAARGAATEIDTTTGEIRGTVRIAPAVLLELVELSVGTIGGIDGLRSLRRNALPGADPAARTYDNGKIAVTVDGDQIGVAIGIAITRGTNVSELSTEVQRQVGFAVGRMLGMTVNTVDIYIEEITAGPA